MKLFYSIAVLALTVGAFSNAAYAGGLKTLDCMPPGYDGTPEVKGEIIDDTTLISVTETYMFEQGAMEPSKLGKLIAEPREAGYDTQVFTLEHDQTGFEYLLLPQHLAALPAGSSFKATYIERDSVTGKPITEHRSLNCKVLQ